MLSPVLSAISAQDQATLVVLCLAGLFFVVQVVDKSTATWHRLKRRPSVDEVFATKPELLKVREEVKGIEERIESRMENSFAEQGRRIDGLEKTLSTFTQEISRSLGRIEGHIKTD